MIPSPKDCKMTDLLGPQILFNKISVQNQSIILGSLMHHDDASDLSEAWQAAPRQLLIFTVVFLSLFVKENVKNWGNLLCVAMFYG